MNDFYSHIVFSSKLLSCLDSAAMIWMMMMMMNLAARRNLV